MRTIILFIVALIYSGVAFAADVPSLRAHVNDYADLLSAETVASLEKTLTDFEQGESTQIVVLIVPSLEGEPVEEFSIRVAEAWKIGIKGKDNGAILLISVKDRKVRIEVGRGLEGTMTDLVSGRIIRGIIQPSFREKHFDAGVTAAVAAMISAAKGEFHAEPSEKKHRKSASPIFSAAIFLLVACVFVGSISRFLGGAVGAVGLPAAAWMLLPGVSLIPLLGLAVAGFIAGLFVSFLFGSGGGGGGPWYGGGGPYFGGGFGGGSGGGDFGGGFSGGGGDFGGGGASGDW